MNYKSIQTDKYRYVLSIINCINENYLVPFVLDGDIVLNFDVANKNHHVISILKKVLINYELLNVDDFAMFLESTDQSKTVESADIHRDLNEAKIKMGDLLSKLYKIDKFLFLIVYFRLITTVKDTNEFSSFFLSTLASSIPNEFLNKVYLRERENISINDVNSVMDIIILRDKLKGDAYYDEILSIYDAYIHDAIVCNTYEYLQVPLSYISTVIERNINDKNDPLIMIEDNVSPFYLIMNRMQFILDFLFFNPSTSVVMKEYIDMLEPGSSLFESNRIEHLSYEFWEGLLDELDRPNIARNEKNIRNNALELIYRLFKKNYNNFNEETSDKIGLLRTVYLDLFNEIKPFIKNEYQTLDAFIYAIHDMITSNMTYSLKSKNIKKVQSDLLDLLIDPYKVPNSMEHEYQSYSDEDLKVSFEGIITIFYTLSFSALSLIVDYLIEYMDFLEDGFANKPATLHYIYVQCMNSDV